MKRHFSASHFVHFALLALSLGLSACGPLAGETTSEVLRQVDADEPINSTKVPACTVDYADFNLDTQVLAFEIVDRWGAAFGFNILEGFFEALGVKLSSERGQMIMSMGLTEVMKPKDQVAYVTGRGQSQKREFRFKIDAIKLGTELSYFRSTPLSKLMEKTLRDSLGQLSGTVQQKASAWKSKVVFAKNSEVVIPSGALAGIRPGDEFSLYNVEYLWAGAPCESDLLMERKTTTQPLAKAVAIQVENNSALLRLTPGDNHPQIQVGARVEISQLVARPENGPVILARPVRIRSVKSLQLDLPQNLKFDVVAFVQEQLRALLNEYHFQHRQ